MNPDPAATQFNHLEQMAGRGGPQKIGSERNRAAFPLLAGPMTWCAKNIPGAAVGGIGT